MSRNKPRKTWAGLNREIEACSKCKRLTRHCQKVAVEKRKAYLEDDYWGKPVSNFGPAKSSKSPKSELLIVGLAPGAHGANRTGRMFTGDRSGDWLFRALHKAGFANQPECVDRKDGLKLINCAITNICHCAPPDNKPNRKELINCQPFFQQTLELCQPKVMVALGGMAWRATIDLLVETEQMTRIKPRPKFAHAAKLNTGDRWLLGCYHPSQQNTFTGRLTEKMLDQVFATAKKLIRS